MVKTKLNILGTVKVMLLVTKGNNRPVKLIGSSTAISVKNNFNEMLRNAILDGVAQYNYKSSGNVGDSAELKRMLQRKEVVYEVIDYDISYDAVKKFYSIKRTKIRGKYYNLVRNKKNGQIVTLSKWSWNK